MVDSFHVQTFKPSKFHGNQPDNVCITPLTDRKVGREKKRKNKTTALSGQYLVESNVILKGRTLTRCHANILVLPGVGRGESRKPPMCNDIDSTCHTVLTTPGVSWQ